MARVVVLGSSNTDMVVRLPRLPRAGETVLGGDFLTGPGGKGANQAVAARRAGADVTFLTAVGDDVFGREALEGYRRERIDVRPVVVSAIPSGIALIFSQPDGENIIGVAPGANLHLSPEHLDDDGLSPAFEPNSVFLASVEIRPETLRHGLRLAKRRGMTVVLNPAPGLARADFACLRDVDVLTPNRGEAEALTGLEVRSVEQAVEAGRSILVQGVESVIVTLGAEGCVVIARSEICKIPGYRVQAVDAVGAGDAFNGALAVALAEGRSLVDSARWASAAAALAVTRSGAQAALPDRAAIDRFAATSPG